MLWRSSWQFRHHLIVWIAMKGWVINDYAVFFMFLLDWICPSRNVACTVLWEYGMRESANATLSLIPRVTLCSLGFWWIFHLKSISLYCVQQKFKLSTFVVFLFALFTENEIRDLGRTSPYVHYFYVLLLAFGSRETLQEHFSCTLFYSVIDTLRDDVTRDSRRLVLPSFFYQILPFFCC